jgi:WD domain, G-beta repeat
MPLPSDITNDPDPRVGEDEFGNMMVVTKDGLAATFKDGRWQPGFLFHALSWMNEFWMITDQHKKDLILSAAADALREFKLTAPEGSNKEPERSTRDDSRMPYHITVFDNFHRGECWSGGGCLTAEEAIAYVKETVDRDLIGFWSHLRRDRTKPTQPTLDELIRQYKWFAETPVAFDDKGKKIFDTIAYMESRAVEIIGDAGQASLDKTIKLWDASRGAVLKTLTGRSEGIGAVAFSPDGKTIASSSRDGTIRLWDAAKGTLLKTIEDNGDSVNSVAFSSDGKWIAAGDSRNTIKLWSAADGSLLKILQGHTGWALSVAVASDGQRIASGSKDGTIDLWDAASGTLIKTLAGHGGGVAFVAFTPDGKTLVSRGFAETTKFWDGVNGVEFKMSR